MLVIIFSFNRPIFLHTLLLSLEKYFKNSNYKVTVIYNYSNEFYKAGYDKLKNIFNYRFVKEDLNRKDGVIPYLTYWRNIYRLIKYESYRTERTNFRNILIHEILNTNISEVMFLTDDSFFYREFFICEDILNKIRSDILNNSFHLRFGLNYESKPTSFSTVNGNIYSWRLDETNDKDFSYRFSIDGQIYNKDFLLSIIRKIIFFNPTTLEGNLNFYCSQKNFLKNGFCFNESVLVGFELNIVSNLSKNNNMNIDNNDLNKYFLDGYKMQYLFDENNVKSFRPNLKDVLLVKEDKKISVFKNFEEITDGKLES